MNIYIVFLMVCSLGFLLLIVFVVDSNIELLVGIVPTCKLFSIVKLLLLLIILRFQLRPNFITIEYLKLKKLISQKIR